MIGLEKLLATLAPSLFTAPEKPKRETRVGLLNTGELIILPADGRILVLSESTTELVRDALWADDMHLADATDFEPGAPAQLGPLQ